MAIYTRTGDKGKTSLFGGKRVLKSDPRVEAYGNVDELNSVIGLVVATLSSKHLKIKKELEKIQHDLFAIGSYLASPKADPVLFLIKRATDFESMIDGQDKILPPLNNFILPGGGRAGASLHQARTVCRRVERGLVALMQKEEVDENVVKYINRLSDLLFSTARLINHKDKKKETIWKQV
jgi:cob(I)alamin adenosyltransferase